MTTHPSVRVLAASIRANVPVILWGNPGIGKTKQIELWGSEWGYHVETVVGSNREAVDFLGFPADRDGVTGYLSFAWAENLRNALKGLLFLDELTTAVLSVQKAMLRVLQERYVGDTKLPDTVSIVAAANSPDVAVDGWELAGPVANRLIHIDWYFDADEWREGLVSGFEFATAPDLLEILSPQPRLVAARSMVAAFLNSRPDLINPGPPKDPILVGRGWPSPRSWTNFSTVAAHLREDDQDALMIAAIGCVGEGAGREFIAWFMTSDLYNTDEVLDDPSIVDWTVRPDRIYALVLSLASVARMRGDTKTWTKAAAAMASCASHGRPDLAYPGMRQLMQAKPDDARISPAVTAAFSDLFVSTGRWSADVA